MNAEELASWLQAVRHPTGDYTQGEALEVVVGEINRLHLEIGKKSEQIVKMTGSIRKIRLRLIEVATAKHTTMDESDSIYSLLKGEDLI